MIFQNLIDGVEAVRDGRYEDAIQLLADDSASTTGLTAVQEVHRLFHLGVAYDNTARPKDAAPCYQQALEIDQDHIPSMSNLAGYYVDEDLHINAQLLYQRLFEIDPSNAAHPYNFGLLFYKYAQYPQQFAIAASCFSHAIELDSTFVKAFEMRAICALQAGKPQDAGEDLLFLLFSAPGWRDNISDEMKQVMSGVWGDEQTQRHLDVSRYAPRPVARIFARWGEALATSDAFRSKLLDQALFAREALARDAATGASPPVKAVYGIVAEEEFQDGLAGCQIDEYGEGEDRWVANIPVPLIEFLHLMVLLIDRPLPREDTASTEDATAYWRLRGFSADEIVEVQRNPDAVDESGMAWDADFRTFLFNHGRDLFSAIIRLESTGEERSQAIFKLAQHLPGYGSKSDAEYRSWAARLAMKPFFASCFLLHHEWAHVFAKHRTIEAEFVGRERALLWCSELVADRHAMVSLLRATFDKVNGPETLEFTSLAQGVAIVMTAVELQHRLGDPVDLRPEYPPPALRIGNIRGIVGERENRFGMAWDVLMYSYFTSAKAVAKACNWPDLEAAVRSLFLAPVAQDDIDFVNQHWNEVITKSIAAGGRPLVVGDDPD